jgi:cytochrome b
MSSTTKVRIWDAPIRLYHWALVLLIGGSWITQWKGWMNLHFLFGETILALLLFRLIWGLVGSDSARFRTFLKSPAAVLRYLSKLHRRGPDTELGHNAAGGWMVLVLLGLLLLQVGTGLFANDDDSLTEGPLRHIVSKGASDFLSRMHGFAFTAIEIAVILHVAAIVVYLVLKGHNLIRPMITGTKRIPQPVAAPKLASPARAIVVLCAAAFAVVAMLRFL